MPRISTFARFSVVLAISAFASCSDESPFTPPDGNPNDTMPPVQPADTIAPSTVTDPSLRMLGRNVVFQWTAPHDDTQSDTVDFYEIRFAYTRGAFPPDFWDLSTPVVNPPEPDAPGNVQTYTFLDPDRGKDLYVGIRSYDAAGNASEPSDLASLHVPGLAFHGRCTDANTGAPVEGLNVRITAGGEVRLTTDANGEFVLDDILPGGVSVEIQSGSAALDYHRLNQLFVIDDDTTHAFTMIRVEPTTAPELNGINRLSFFKLITETLGPATLLAKWREYPVPCYIAPFVNGGGVNYELQSKAAARRWNERTGNPIFRFVDSPPDTGIVVRYRSRQEISPLIAFTTHNLDSEGHPITKEIHVVDDFAVTEASFLYSVMLHEFGHTIRFGHIDIQSFLMFGGHLSANDITDDEAAAAILHWAMPTRVDMKIYDESTP